MEHLNQATPSRGHTIGDAFSTPFNWCDSRCQHCPLMLECPLCRKLEQKRWVHEARGENWDDPGVVMQDISQELASVMETIRLLAIQQGIDLAAPLPRPLIALDEVRLRKAGLELSVALAALTQSPEYTKQSQAIDDAVAAGITLTLKAARIGAYLADRSSDIWNVDAVPNLLLVERVLTQLTNALSQIDDEGFDKPTLEAIRKATSNINRTLSPLIVAIGRPPRLLLEALVARGAAPSPFCTRTRPTE